MPKAAKIDSSIELTCSLCPKTPTFSDISHLLTHISSKSHLSHRFKLQIRANTEPEAKEKLDYFDNWYQDNNLDTMLSQRLAAKSQKKTTKERKARVSNASIVSSLLAMDAVKMEQKPLKETIATTPVFRAPVPRMHLWPTANTSSSTPTRDWEESNIYSTPTMRRKVPNFTPAEAVTPGGDMLDSKPATPWKPDGSDGIDADEEQEKAPDKAVEKLSDSTKLKGVLWPGMDLFDSATPEMKRMRNQRKDSSVLEQMIATSTGVEPTEVVYHPNGEISHSRDIFGPLSTENSPNQIQDPTPKKRKPRKMVAALSDISVNAPRLRVPRPKRNTGAHAPTKCPSADVQQLAPPAHPFLHAPTLNSLANFAQRYVPSSEEDEEFRMTVGDMTKKRPFGIFQDALPEVSPGRTESSLEDHRFDFSSDRMTSHPKDVKYSNYISPTPAARASTMRGFGKENGRSGLSPAVHHRQTVSMPGSHIYSGQMFYDPVLNPLYDPGFARAFPYGRQQPSSNEDLKTHLPRFHSALHGEIRPIHSNPRPSDQQGYLTASNDNNDNPHISHYGV